jgi:hypothetical protein
MDEIMFGWMNKKHLRSAVSNSSLNTEKKTEISSDYWTEDDFSLFTKKKERKKKYKNRLLPLTILLLEENTKNSTLLFESAPIPKSVLCVFEEFITISISFLSMLDKTHFIQQQHETHNTSSSIPFCGWIRENGASGKGILIDGGNEFITEYNTIQMKHEKYNTKEKEKETKREEKKIINEDLQKTEEIVEEYIPACFMIEPSATKSLRHFVKYKKNDFDYYYPQTKMFEEEE